MPEVLTESPLRSLLSRASHGQDVIHLQAALARAGCFEGDIDGSFGLATETALRLFQQQQGMPQTGIFTATESAQLGWSAGSPRVLGFPGPLLPLVQQIFSPLVKQNVATNLPALWAALEQQQLTDAGMFSMALATVKVETASFLPVSEPRSALNTSPDGSPFDLYDTKPGLGNRGAPDGSRFRGRGFIQLTGRANYLSFSAACKLGTQLVDDPFLAHDAAIAAQLLAAFLKNRESRIRAALRNGELGEARKAVNGGTNGLPAFTEAFQMAQSLLTPVLATIQR